jgi:transcriptional regulator with XRE-family HTH domain
LDLSTFVNQRLTELDLEQKDLAVAAEVTESYISQLLSRKKPPPSPGRTDIYEKMDLCLRLPPGQLARLADLERKDQLKRELGDEPQPLFGEVRALILKKCNPEKTRAVQTIFERQPFGELERLIIQKMLEVTRPVARDELENEQWLRMMARLSGRNYEEMRVVVLEFLDTEISAVSIESSVAFLEPLIKTWDIDLASFDLEIVLNHSVPSGHVKRFGFIERDREELFSGEPGLDEFLRDPTLSGTATEDEIAFLTRLTFTTKRPTPLYYYRELQNLRDPLHFRAA